MITETLITAFYGAVAIALILAMEIERRYRERR